MSLQTVQCFVRQEVSVSSQQPGQTQEGLYQEESGECFPVSLIIYLPLCLTVLPSGFHQVMLARQAVRFRRRVTRKTTKQRLIDSRKLLRTLRLLAKEVRSRRVVTIQSTKIIIKCLVRLMCDPLPNYLTSPRLPSQMCFYGSWVEESDWLMSGSLPTLSSSHWWKSRGGRIVAKSPPSTWR